jgi:hypothetical protein
MKVIAHIKIGLTCSHGADAIDSSELAPLPFLLGGIEAVFHSSDQSRKMNHATDVRSCDSGLCDLHRPDAIVRPGHDPGGIGILRPHCDPCIARSGNSSRCHRLKTVLAQQVAAMGVPLPTMLAGISVTLTQAGQQTPVPLLSIQQLSACSNGGVPPPPSPYSAKPDCLITVITVQIPTELIVASGDRPPTTSQLVVNENGTMSEAFTISPVADKLHIMTTCDVFPSPHLIRGSQPVTSSVPACTSLVTHANGDLITVSEPAEANEEIVVWAFGLGLTTPASKTGEASPTPAAVLSSPPYVEFDFRPNAGPSRPYINPLIMAPFVPGAIFAGLTPGQVGL